MLNLYKRLGLMIQLANKAVIWQHQRSNRNCRCLQRRSTRRKDFQKLERNNLKRLQKRKNRHSNRSPHFKLSGLVNHSIQIKTQLPASRRKKRRKGARLTHRYLQQLLKQLSNNKRSSIRL